MAAVGLLHDLERYEKFLFILNQHQQQVERPVNRKDPFQVYNEAEFRYRYRFSKQTTVELIGILSPTLYRHTTRRDALPVHLQVLTALRFYAVGEFETLSIVSDICVLIFGFYIQLMKLSNYPQMAQCFHFSLILDS